MARCRGKLAHEVNCTRHVYASGLHVRFPPLTQARKTVRLPPRLTSEAKQTVLAFAFMSASAAYGSTAISGVRGGYIHGPAAPDSSSRIERGEETMGHSPLSMFLGSSPVKAT